jgi:hypothetical protein
MSEETVQHGDAGNRGLEHEGPGFEREDLGAKTVFAFLLGLVVLGVVVYFIANGVYWSLDRYSGAHQPAQNPMKQNVETDTRDERPADVRATIQRIFPEPRLETDERSEINEARRREDEQLNSYGWVDQPAGVVHIPIERAMQLVLARGLAVRPESQATPAGVASRGQAQEKTPSHGSKP